MSTLTQFFNQNHLSSQTHAQYEVIENEIIKSCDFSDLSVSGSLFSLTTFTNVSFKSCVFYGSRFENCDFINCTFEDCKFEFNNMVHCNFVSSTFENCTWAYSYLRKSSLYDCMLDPATKASISVEENKLERCFETEHNAPELTWTQVLSQPVSSEKDLTKTTVMTKKSA